MTPFKIDNPWPDKEQQEKIGISLNYIDHSTQKSWISLSSKPKYLIEIEKKQDEALLHLDQKIKTDLIKFIWSEIAKLSLIQLQVLKNKLLLQLPLTSPQDKESYGQFYLLLKLDESENIEVGVPMIIDLIDRTWDFKYRKEYGDSRAVRNKNPWNLRMKWDLGKDKGWFAIFSSLEAGWSAFTSMVSKWQTGVSKIYKPTFTLIQWAKKYDKSNPSYAKKLAKYLWVSVKTQLKDIPADKLATAIVHHEDGNCYRALKAKGLIK